VNELALFAGAGGGILGSKLLGWRTVCAVERDAYAAQVLAQRQNDGAIEPFPIWSDVCSFDGRPWRGIVDVISGGFPCQDISAAGKGAGIDGKRSGLWSEMARIVCDIRPQYVFVENSPVLTSRGLGRVLGDLDALGYDAKWTVLSAADVGAPHLRERIWILANTSGERSNSRCKDTGRQTRSQVNRHCEASGIMANTNGKYDNDSRHRAGEVSQLKKAELSGCKNALSDAKHDRRERRNATGPGQEKSNPAMSYSWWATEPDVGRVAHGVAARVDRLRAIGNGQVPLTAATAFRLLST